MALKNKTLHNQIFSREYFCKLTIVAKHAAMVAFIPGSQSYLYYGERVTIENILTEDELLAMVRKFNEKDPELTYGAALGKALAKDGLSDAQVEHLRTIGFNTQDVLESYTYKWFGMAIPGFS